MSLSRYAKKRDANEREIIDALVKCGCSVQQLDCIDLLVNRAGKLFLLEIKARSTSKLTPAQLKFRRSFPFAVCLCPEDALRAVGFSDMRARVDANARAVDRHCDAVLAAFHRGELDD